MYNNVVWGNADIMKCQFKLRILVLKSCELIYIASVEQNLEKVYVLCVLHMCMYMYVHFLFCMYSHVCVHMYLIFITSSMEGRHTDYYPDRR